MIEPHPFLEQYEPATIKHLFIGTFPCTINGENPAWFYGSRRNLFWQLIQGIFDCNLVGDLKSQLIWARSNDVWFTDICSIVKRKRRTCSDKNLQIINFNTAQINNYIQKKSITAIYYTSTYAKKLTEENSDILKLGNISEVLLSPSPAFNRYLGRVQAYKNWKISNIGGDVFTYRLLNYKEVFRRKGLIKKCF